MRYFLITLILLFYFFFFIRAFTLSKSLGKNIKAKNSLLNWSIISAGLSSVIFLAYLTAPPVSEYLIILFSSNLLTIIGSVLITLGVIMSTIASLTLKKSWRIGVDENEKTELITTKNMEPEKCTGWLWVDPKNLPIPHFDASQMAITCYLEKKFYKKFE